MPTKPRHANPFRVMSFGDHLEELRTRVILALLGLVVALVAGLILGGPLLALLLKPLINALHRAGQPTQLLATGPLETFVAYLKVGFLFSILVAFPWMLYQLWLFVAPGLHAAERRFVYFLVPLSAILSALSALFLYYFMLPVSLYFLIIFGTGIIEQHTPAAPVPPGIVAPTVPVLAGDPPKSLLLAPDTPFPVGSSWINSQMSQLRFHLGDGRIKGMPLTEASQIAQLYRVGEYISMIVGLAVAFAVAFQLPLVMLLLAWVGILNASDITPYRRHAIFGCAIAGAVLTPQDPWSMVMLTSALYFLFELGIILMKFVPPRAVATRFGTAHDADKEPADASDE